jgi:hypothetical protein
MWFLVVICKLFKILLIVANGMTLSSSTDNLFSSLFNVSIKNMSLVILVILFFAVLSFFSNSSFSSSTISSSFTVIDSKKDSSSVVCS